MKKSKSCFVMRPGRDCGGHVIADGAGRNSANDSFCAGKSLP
ncbi:hypothetical protein X739_03325 [Mesorhizobium sp. LNHC220B00]|nr:hypothetical protein X739_03325 [Mesorhizobium sp. LNHC220B00]ESZ00079.1 hypothetical protein X738_10810 [Mesorhizobium sp. LNHC209A00]